MEALINRRVEPVAWLDITDELYVFLDGFPERQQFALGHRDSVFISVEVCAAILNTWTPDDSECEAWDAFSQLVNDIRGWGYEYAILTAPVDDDIPF